MDLLTTPDQEAVIASAAGFLAKELPISGIRERREQAEAFDRKTWERCAELGWFGLGVSEERGGIGYSAAEEALLFREIGRYLASGPFVSTVLGSHIAAAAGQTELFEQIMSGSVVVGAAQARPGTDVDIAGEVSGTLDLIDAVGTELVAIVTQERAVLVRTEDLGPQEQQPSIDPGVRVGTVTVSGVPVVAEVTAEQEPIFARGLVLIAALQVGIAEAVRDMAVEHAKNRVQFGKPIGVNQAIKHRCVDMALRAESARAQLLFGALAVSSGRADAAFHAASARVVASDAAIKNSSENIQIHGGMGYTYEHDSHLFVRRARVLDQLLCGPAQALGLLIGLPPAQVGRETQPTA
jgi:alkylation response protein AidB-like acyl-CoA dehydrogenase